MTDPAARPCRPPQPGRRRRLAAALLAAALGAGQAAAQDAPSLAERYKPQADALIAAALASDNGYANLTELCDGIGKRVSGSEPLQRAIAWATALMAREGLSNVHTQPVMVPHWVRGAEAGAITAPVAKPLHLLGLGMSIGTPPGGLTADVVVVPSIERLQQLGREAVEGKIVVYDVPWQGYGKTVRERVIGASRAAELGAVAMLVRSITPLAMQAPHTGTLVYDEKAPKIPAAAISPEDAAMLTRLTARGGMARVHIEMQAHMEADVRSANVVGELPGSSLPDEVVVLGGHIDSWDVGQGAQDDGSGIMAALDAVRVIQQAGLKPRRTVRVVFWVNEENGGAGGRAYRAAVGDRIDQHVAAIEMDGGAEQPIGYGYGASGAGRPPGAGGEPEILPAEQHSFALLRDIARLLQPVGADTIRAGGFGSDIEPLTKDGVPALGELTTMAHYFDWHHTEADTLDKVDPQDFRKNVASLAVMAYVLADMPERLAGHKAEPKAK